jgi:hypothetical protein
VSSYWPPDQELDIFSGESYSHTLNSPDQLYNGYPGVGELALRPSSIEVDQDWRQLPHDPAFLFPATTGERDLVATEPLNKLSWNPQTAAVEPLDFHLYTATGPRFDTPFEFDRRKTWAQGI